MIRSILLVGSVAAIVAAGSGFALAAGGAGAGAGAGGTVGELPPNWSWNDPYAGYVAPDWGWGGRYANSCVQPRIVETPFGPQQRLVNVC